jgi:hypothetical protein
MLCLSDMSLLTELSSFSPVWSINIQAPTEPNLHHLELTFLTSN